MKEIYERNYERRRAVDGKHAKNPADCNQYKQPPQPWRKSQTSLKNEC